MYDILIVGFTFIVAAATVALVSATMKLAEITKATQQEMKDLQERMNWLTGSMESHSSLMVRLEAKKQGIQAVWWDPTEEDWPLTGPHGANATIEKIRIGMNPRDRKEIPRA